MSEREEQLMRRLKQAQRMWRYWKGQSLREMMRTGAVEVCTEHHEPRHYDPFAKPVARTAQREAALRRAAR